MAYEIQLQWMHKIHFYLQCPFMDIFFKIWNLVDTIYFTALIIPLTWYLLNKQLGIRLFYILTISSISNIFLKILFDQPRPCQIDPSVAILCFSSPGFPSGAAQTAALVCGILFFEFRNFFIRFLGVLFAFFLCFSRIYLGVHFFTDIIGGLSVGLFLLLVYKKAFPLFTKDWKGASLVFPFFILLLGFFSDFFFPGYLYLFFLSLGLSLGLMTSAHKAVRQDRKTSIRCVQTGIVLGGLIVLFALEFAFPSLRMLFSLMQGYWLSSGEIFLVNWKKLTRP